MSMDGRQGIDEPDLVVELLTSRPPGPPGVEVDRVQPL